METAIIEPDEKKVVHVEFKKTDNEDQLPENLFIILESGIYFEWGKCPRENKAIEIDYKNNLIGVGCFQAMTIRKLGRELFTDYYKFEINFFINKSIPFEQILTYDFLLKRSDEKSIPIIQSIPYKSLEAKEEAALHQKITDNYLASLTPEEKQEMEEQERKRKFNPPSSERFTNRDAFDDDEQFRDWSNSI